MSDTELAGQEKKEAMKRLRQERQESIRKAAALVKSRKAEIRAVTEQLAGEEGATAPEIAEATGMDVSRAIWYLATLKHYGDVVEGAKDGSYFRYRLVMREAQEA